MDYIPRGYRWRDRAGAGDQVWSRAADAGLGKWRDVTVVPADLGFGKGEILGEPRSSFVDFIILQFGVGYYSLEKGGQKNVEEINEDS